MIANLLDRVRAPSRLTDSHLPEQLSFLQLRENFRCFIELFASGRDVPAAHLCRALFEESARWSWVDDDRENRRAAFVVEAARAHGLIVKAAERQGIDPTPLFGEIASQVLAAAESETVRFPTRFEDLFDWTPPGLQEMLYLQYRVLSQYTHSSLLSAGSSTVIGDGQMINKEQLPSASRLLIIRSACGSAAFVLDFCKDGLEWPSNPLEPPLNLVLAGIAARVADTVYPFSPGSA
jgi:hypothetical protein